MTPTPAIRHLVPMVFVRSVPAAIAFYELLGFEADNRFTQDGASEPTWASLVSGRAALMLAKATKPVVASEQAVIFYVYCDDVAATREILLARGVAAGPIQTPFYAPRGEFRVKDPDGYAIMVTHT